MKPVAVISGGTRGIGLAVAKRLKASHDVVVIGRNPTTLQEVEQTLGVRGLQLDLAVPDSIEEAAKSLALDRVDVLIHSAGVLFTGNLEETTTEAFEQSLTVNVTAVASLTRALLRPLEEAGGKVVMVNSGAGRHGSATSIAYATSKFALNGLAESLRLDLGPRGIQVSTIAPGRTGTDMQRQLVASEGAQYTPEAYLTAEGVADAIVYIITQGGDIDYLSIRPPQR